MKYNTSEKSFGWFKEIRAEDVIIVDLIKKTSNTLSGHLDFTEPTPSNEKISISDMVNDLKSRGIRIGNKIEKLISSGFFNKSLCSSLEEMYPKVAIIKGRTTQCRYISVLIRDGFPEDFYLVLPEVTFHVAYIISHFFTKEFLNIHNMDRIYIMSDPLKKLDEHDDHLITEWDPSYRKSITTGLYNNPYTGDGNAGYLFFTI